MSAQVSVLRVGVDAAPPPPLCHGLPGNPDFRGFEVDLMQVLAQRLGRALTFQASRWTELLDRLEAGDLELICTAATITSERQARFLFSEPYLRTTLALISRGDAHVHSLAGFGGVVGARAGTPAEAYAVESGLEPVRFHSNGEIYRELERGALGVVVDDLPIGAWFAAHGQRLQVATVKGTDGRYGVVMRRDAAELKTAVDIALRALLADGTYTQLYDKWLRPLLEDLCDIAA